MSASVDVLRRAGGWDSCVSVKSHPFSHKLAFLPSSPRRSAVVRIQSMRPKPRSGPAPYERRRWSKWKGSIWSVPRRSLSASTRRKLRLRSGNRIGPETTRCSTPIRSASSQEILDPSWCKGIIKPPKGSMTSLQIRWIPTRVNILPSILVSPTLMIVRWDAPAVFWWCMAAADPLVVTQWQIMPWKRSTALSTKRSKVDSKKFSCRPFPSAWRRKTSRGTPVIRICRFGKC